MPAAAWSIALPQRSRPLPAEPAAAHGEDLALVARMVAGDDGAVDEFGERYGVALFRFAAARLGGDGELARDIVQTTLTKALARLDGYRGEAALLTWLCACCRNEILMHWRRGRGGPRLVDLAAADAVAATPAGGDAEAALLRKEQAERVHLALDSLPDRYARALEWKYVEQLSVETIAARLGLGPKAAESLLGRARRSFRGVFDDLARSGAASGGEGHSR